MKEWLAFLRTPRFLLPLSVPVVLEAFFASGMYDPLLRPQSYAGHLLPLLRSFETEAAPPEVLIVGSSTAYQAVNLPALNASLYPGRAAESPLRSAALPGAGLLTQHLLYRHIAAGRATRPGIVVHFADPALPLLARHEPGPGERAMAPLLAGGSALAREYEFQLAVRDELRFRLKLFAYREDFKDLLLHPVQRVRALRKSAGDHAQPLLYTNRLEFRLSAYAAADPDACVAAARAGIPERDRAGRPRTDAIHRRSVLETCSAAWRTRLDQPGAEQWSALYFARLKRFYRELHRDGRRVITVFPPLARVVADREAKRRGELWRRALARFGSAAPGKILDLRAGLAGRGDGVFYDAIHLNRDGARLFTALLAAELRFLVGEGGD